jgi:hypothetical protein
VQGDRGPVLEWAWERLEVHPVGVQDLHQRCQLGVGFDNDVAADLEGAASIRRIEDEPTRKDAAVCEFERPGPDRVVQRMAEEPAILDPGTMPRNSL